MVVPVLTLSPGSPGPLAGGSTVGSTTVSVNASRPGGLVNQQLLGADGPGPANATGEMAALGLQWVRTDVGFEGSAGGKPDYNCATGAWNPGPLDSTVDQIHAEGAAPLLIVDYTPACLAPLSLPAPADSSYEPPDLGPDRAKWDTLVYAMALHEITAEGVRAFEIWNEPDGTFWYGGLPGYILLYQDTATVLEEAARSAGVHIEVGGPALFFADPTWIEPFLAFVAGHHLPLDFLSWHWYGNYPALGPIAPLPQVPTDTPAVWYNPLLEPQTYGAEVAQVRAEVARFPSLHPTLWIDEWNVDAGYDARQSGPYDAAFAAAVLQSVQLAGLGRMTFFDVEDGAGNPDANWGMLTTSGVPKPVYATFRFWHDLGTHLLGVEVSPRSASGALADQVGAVAAGGPDGTVTVLVYNFLPFDPTGNNGLSGGGPYGRAVAVRLSGLGDHSYEWSRSLVDGAHSGTVVARGTLGGPSSELSFPLGEDSVSLLQLSPG